MTLRETARRGDLESHKEKLTVLASELSSAQERAEEVAESLRAVADASSTLSNALASLASSVNKLAPEEGGPECSQLAELIATELAPKHSASSHAFQSSASRIALLSTELRSAASHSPTHRRRSATRQLGSQLSPQKLNPSEPAPSHSRVSAAATAPPPPPNSESNNGGSASAHLENSASDRRSHPTRGLLHSRSRSTGHALPSPSTDKDGYPSRKGRDVRVMHSRSKSSGSGERPGERHAKLRNASSMEMGFELPDVSARETERGEATMALQQADGRRRHELLNAVASAVNSHGRILFSLARSFDSNGVKEAVEHVIGVASARKETAQHEEAQIAQALRDKAAEAGIHPPAAAQASPGAIPANEESEGTSSPAQQEVQPSCGPPTGSERYEQIASGLRGICDNDDQSTNAVMEGYLHKITQSGSFWRLRYFCLWANGSLTYSQRREPTRSEHKDTIPLMISTIKLGSGGATNLLSCASESLCFRIVSPRKWIALSAPSQAERDAWLEHLSVATRECIVQRPSSAVHLRSKSNTLQNGATRVLEKIQRWGNMFCADCGCGSSSVTWTSTSFGVMLCSSCSGVHRNLGAHLSTVRSACLDRNAWDVPLLQRFAIVGSSISSEALEGRLTITDDEKDEACIVEQVPPPRVESEKPSESASTDARQRFADSKYVKRAYVSAVDRRFSSRVLDEAVERIDPRLATVAMICGADAAENDRIHHTASNESSDAVLALLDVLVRLAPSEAVNTTDQNGLGRTPLHSAMALGREDNALALITRGADYNARDCDGRTPLEVSMYENQCVRDYSLLIALHGGKSPPEENPNESENNGEDHDESETAAEEDDAGDELDENRERHHNGCDDRQQCPKHRRRGFRKLFGKANHCKT